MPSDPTHTGHMHALITFTIATYSRRPAVYFARAEITKKRRQNIPSGFRLLLHVRVTKYAESASLDAL